ncbi:alpha/beta hydrolase [Nocardia sp. 2]|uniref:Alpha/beta hydrolase n=1 Tax=Nocardia acididurans TaxID=2802282 RepID=A0ABS1LYY8_9NOCA|nr:alpha/beta hydrolase [Nocardia acididurans]MBL1073129.1 alpha/beta hydrolase [Nocardia acididurans]
MSEFVVVPGARVRVCDEGDPTRKALVLLHGFCGSVHWFERMTPLLIDQYRVVRIDLAGHGLTRSRGSFDPDAQARLVESVLARLEVNSAVAVGHSMGADIAIELSRVSDRVSELVVIGQAPDYSYANLPKVDALFTLPFVAQAVHRMAPAVAVRQALRAGFARGFPMERGFDDPRQAMLDHALTNPGVYRVVSGDRRKALAARPLDRRIRESGLPTLVIHGAADQMYDCAKTAARYRDAGAMVRIVEGAGHSPNVEKPAETVAAIREFLAERQAAGA